MRYNHHKQNTAVESRWPVRHHLAHMPENVKRKIYGIFRNVLKACLPLERVQVILTKVTNSSFFVPQASKNNLF